MKSKLMYCLLFFATIYIAVMYNGYFARLVLCFLVLVPIISACVVMILQRAVDAQISVAIPVVEKKQTIAIRITLKNKMILPVSKLRIRLVLQNVFTGEKEQVDIPAMIDGNEELVLKYKVSSRYCGRIHLYTAYIRIWDYLNLFSLPRKVGGTSDVTVLPGIHEMDVQVSEFTRMFISDSEEYDPHRPGDDPSEVFGIRDYRGGDSMSKIHWKLSAKTDDLMVKEFSRPIGCAVLLLLDFYYIAEKNEKLGKRLDAFMEAAASICFAIAEQECIYRLGWFDDRKQEISFHTITKSEDVYEAVQRLFSVPVHEAQSAMEQLYEEAALRDRYSSILTLNLELELVKNKHLAAAYDRQALKESLMAESLVI